MTVPPLLRAPAARLLLVAYPALAAILPAAGRPWLTVPLCLTALAATGALWIRALPGLPAETGVPAVRPGLAAAAGLITVPLVALLLHMTGQPVRPAPLVIACTALVTVLGAVALLRDHRAVRRAGAPPGLPVQRRHDTSPGSVALLPGADDPLSSGGEDASGPLFPGGDGGSGPRFSDADGGSGPRFSDADRGSGPRVSGGDGGSGPLFSGADGASDAALPDARSGRAGSGRAGSGRAGSGRAGSGAPLADADLPGAGRGPARTTVAVTIPLVLAAGVGGPAVHRYLTAPHPAEPGYLSVALNGWAAAIDSPVTVPARGLVVPIRVTSAGLADTTSLLQLRVGGQVLASRPMTVAADSVRSLTVYVPALPADGRLRTVAISVGGTSIGFHALGHADGSGSPLTSAGAAVTGPGVRPHTATGGDRPAGRANGPGAHTGPAGAVGDPAAPGRTVPGQVRGMRGPSVTSAGDDAAPGRTTSGEGQGMHGPSAAPARDRGAGVRASSAGTAGDRGAGASSAGSAGDRAAGVRRPSTGPARDRRAGVRASSAGPAGDRGAWVRPPTAGSAGDRGAGVRVSSAGAAGDRATGVRATPSTGGADGASAVPGRPMTSGANGGTTTPGAGPVTHAEDRRRPAGTKGGRAVGAPRQSPVVVSGADGVPLRPFAPGHEIAEPGRVTCSGKRRAVLAGERTAC
ncbi:hypothetical protein BC793_102546 [Actinoplanes xinjiangensis]|uniref:Uncharacterized protein n=1 Tax=Actinoplanes xinjiangensis TaxID=512350 RepID=A0A316FV11_9ACTN|nr:hypothetical protein BC793_102546 [Actinoplanes xinjiangensis]